MDFFLHSSTARYSQRLLDIEREYGLAGLGFYWKAIELLMQCNTKVPLGNFQALRYKQIGYFDCINIISESGLFYVDEDKNVTLAQNVNYGIDKKSLESYFDKMGKYYGVKVDQLIASPACTPTCVPVPPTPACTPADASVGVCAGSIDMDKEETDIKAAKLLEKYMEENYPHLQQMDEPLTLEQFTKLKANYSKDQIEEVFTQMENKINLYRFNRSCYLTAITWLKHDFGNNNKK